MVRRRLVSEFVDNREGVSGQEDTESEIGGVGGPTGRIIAP